MVCPSSMKVAGYLDTSPARPLIHHLCVLGHLAEIASTPQNFGLVLGRPNANIEIYE